MTRIAVLNIVAVRIQRCIAFARKIRTRASGPRLAKRLVRETAVPEPAALVPEPAALEQAALEPVAPEPAEQAQVSLLELRQRQGGPSQQTNFHPAR